MPLKLQLIEFKINERTKHLITQVEFLASIIKSKTQITKKDLSSIIESLPLNEKQKYTELFITVDSDSFHNSSPRLSLEDSSIDLSHQDICVALLDRPAEMNELTTFNAHLFAQIKSAVFQNKESDWKNFCTVIFTSRNTMNDMEWMAKIEYCLENQPSLLSSFKQLVGYGN